VYLVILALLVQGIFAFQPTLVLLSAAVYAAVRIEERKSIPSEKNSDGKFSGFQPAKNPGTD
jgi:hypothetical protein